MKKKSIIIQVMIIFLGGSCLHFTYDLSGYNILVGIFSAINESVWEHTKMVILPTILYDIIYYIRHKNSINKDSWFSSMIINLIVAIFTMPLLYYFYTGAFGKEILIIDIIIFLLSVIFGTYFGWQFYHKNKVLPWKLLLIIIIVTYVLFTFYQPNIPIFISKE